MNNHNDQMIYTDENGNDFILDEKGNKIPPLQAKIAIDNSYFIHYDNRQGHCSLCGRSTCRGGCFESRHKSI